ncbi:hypothetical protein [Kitasatospora sp. MAP5-34]|uniref:hypothetical protein n=1 Tax=Kitasatospora sp. MAP5-34 TaxID=3035102 RepID=UPI0024761F00|nr:hypothetical protein [Kitasatospora sp. MAP5-34]MDH6579571.1 hypothetical protein [Kitasatospora sp. MAP5-34]
MVASSEARRGAHDQAALDEIELAGELMIAATASPEERLAPERIDQVLLEHGQDDDARDAGEDAGSSAETVPGDAPGTDVGSV